MGKKKNVLLYLDEDVVEEAKELGLNLSKVCENALKEAIKRLKGENCENNSYSPFSNRMAGHTNKKMVRPPGFEPGLGAWRAPVLVQSRPRPQSHFYEVNLKISSSVEHDPTLKG